MGKTLTFERPAKSPALEERNSPPRARSAIVGDRQRRRNGTPKTLTQKQADALYQDGQRLLREVEAEVAARRAAEQNPASCAQNTPPREIVARRVLLFWPRRSRRSRGAR
jgi:hypothetical protein